MRTHWLNAARFVAFACAWWRGVAVYFLIDSQPGPFDPAPFVEWNQMAVVYNLAPWVALPFAAIGVWIIVARTLKLAVISPVWMTWACGAAALLWTIFAAWRAHEQVSNCLLWAPREMIWTAECSLPSLLLGNSGWLAVPIAAWLMLAAVRPARSLTL
jgi:hypothetical protein